MAIENMHKNLLRIVRMARAHKHPKVRGYKCGGS